MKVLKDTQAVQTISIIPRSYPTSLTLTLRDDQTNDIDTYALNSGFSVVNDYLVIDNVYTLREFHFYDLTITDQDSNIIYKDRIFCTNQAIDAFSVNADSGYVLEPSNNDYIII